MSESRLGGRAYLAAVATEARDGSLRLLCPFCDGGPDREISLVLTLRDEGAFYCCHRASCGEKGVLGGANTRRILGEGGSKTPAKQHEPYTGDIVPVSGGYPARRWEAARILDGYTRYPEYFGLWTDSTNSPEVWVLRNVYGERIGVQTRYHDYNPREDSYRKRVRTYKETSGPVYHALLHKWDGKERQCWIVEDALSAAVAHSWGHNAVALLGTYLSPELAMELGQISERTSAFIVALDPGAEHAALRAFNTLKSCTTRDCRVRYLTCDIKDMSFAQLQDVLGEK